jgi:hypothetical protein
VSILTFCIDGLVGAKNVDLEWVIIGDTFGGPVLTVALLLNMAAQQQVTVDLLAHPAWGGRHAPDRLRSR